MLAALTIDYPLLVMYLAQSWWVSACIIIFIIVAIVIQAESREKPHDPRDHQARMLSGRNRRRRAYDLIRWTFYPVRLLGTALIVACFMLCVSVFLNFWQ